MGVSMPTEEESHGKDHEEREEQRPVPGQDLCTVTELRAMEQRFDVAVLLQQGMIYNDILDRTGASSATISRVNRSLSYGFGGYQTYFERLTQEKQAKDAPEAEE